MPERFRAALQIHDERASVEATVREWVVEESGADLADAVGQWTGSDGASLEIAEAARDDRWLREARWLLAPQESSGDRWEVELRLGQHEGPLEFEAVVRNTDLGQRAPRGLGILRVLIEEHDCRHGGIQLPAAAREVDAGNADAFISEWLSNERRQLPVVVLSRDQQGRCARDPDSVQRALAGRALVAVWDSAVSNVVTNRLNDSLGCYNGFVRVYRPRPSSSDNTSDHPFIRWRQAQESGFPDRLREQVRDATPADAFLSSCSEIAEQIQRSESAARQAQVEELKAALRDSEANVTKIVSDSLEELFDDQERKIAHKQEQITKLEVDNQYLRAENDRLEREVTKFSKLRAESGSNRFDEPVTVAEAVSFAQDQCELLTFFESAQKSAAEASNYRGNPEAVLKALKRLDQTASRMAKGEVSPHLVLDELTKLGLDVSGESKDAMNRYGDKREFRNAEGEWVAMPLHIKLGGGQGGDKRCRIHFRWNKDAGKIDVGHVGRHLTTSQS